ncbi:cysteine proteinase, partial [Glonium stellatum]
KVYFFNTYFYSSLSKPQKGQRAINYNAVQRWTAKEDIFNYDYVVVPINEDAHWYVAIICNLTNINRILHEEPSSEAAARSNSLGATHPRTVRHLKDYVLEEGKSKRNIDAIIEKSMNPKEIPLQNNFCDCGLFLLGYLDKFFVNPREFVTKILTREMSVERDWPDLDPKQMRNYIRSLLFKLAKEQQAE